MKILTWNINGIRAGQGKPSVPSGVSAVQATGSALKATLDALHADIICLQETKVTRDQLEESVALIEGYESFFAFSRGRAGYSGVATYCRRDCLPVHAEEGLTPFYQPSGSDGIGCYGDLELWSEADQALVDGEGRAVLTEHRLATDSGCGAEQGGANEKQSVVVINVYCPRAHSDEEQRYAYKMLFYQALELRCRALLKAQRHVVVLGDVNCSHHQIDVCYGDEYCTPEEFLKAPSRLWLDNLIINTHPDDSTVEKSDTRPDDSTGEKSEYEKLESEQSSQQQLPSILVDTFRHYHPTRPNAYTCWCTLTGARKTNFGTRLDYILVDKEFVDRYADSGDIMPEVEGSDHCPVYLDVHCSVVCKHSSVPSLAASRMPEFAGKQQTMKSFLSRPKMGSSESCQPSQASAASAGSGSSSLDRRVVPGLKRGSSSTQSGGDQKRSKCPSGARQKSIAGFFQRKTPVPPGTTTSSTGELSTTGLGEACSATAFSSIDSLLIGSEVSVSSQPPPPPPPSTTGSSETRTSSGAQWKNIFTSRAPKPVLCKGHKEPCVLRTVNKSGVNQFRRFYVCDRPAGSKDNPLARCDHFEWIDKPKLKSKSSEPAQT